MAELKHGQGEVAVGVMGTEMGGDTQWWGRGLGSIGGSKSGSWRGEGEAGTGATRLAGRPGREPGPGGGVSARSGGRLLTGHLAVTDNAPGHLQVLHPAPSKAFPAVSIGLQCCASMVPASRIKGDTCPLATRCRPVESTEQFLS